MQLGTYVNRIKTRNSCSYSWSLVVLDLLAVKAIEDEYGKEAAGFFLIVLVVVVVLIVGLPGEESNRGRA